MRIFIFVGVLAAAVIAAPPGMATPPLSDACSLLTAEQVGDAVSAKTGAGKYVSPKFTKTCTWTAPGVIVTLMLQASEQFQAGKKAPAPSEVTSVLGLGDDAYYLAVGNLVGLGVKKGTTAFKVTVYKSSLPTETKQKMEKTLAQQVLTKL
jgi:hypothetical protein